MSGATAEEMELPPGFAALITACTAFRWFDAAPFYAAAARVLAPLWRAGGDPHPAPPDAAEPIL